MNVAIGPRFAHVGVHTVRDIQFVTGTTCNDQRFLVGNPVVACIMPCNPE